MTRPRVPDPLVAWALTCVAIAGWWTTFAGWAWLAVGVAGATTGAAVVTLHHVRRQLVWAILTGPLAYLLLGVAVLGVDFRGNGLPAADTLSRVVSGSVECWRLLIGTHPPVDATGTVLLAPAGLGVLSAATSTALALSPGWSSRRPTWPVLPLLLLLAAVLVTGSHAPASVLLLGCGFGLACVVWGMARAGRLDPDGPTAAVRWPLAVPILVISAALAVPVGGALLGPQSDRLVLREQAAAYGIDIVGTPLDAFRRYRKQPGDLPDNTWRRPLLRVSEAPAGTVLRFAVLNRYDGRRWVAANDVEPGSHEDRFQLFSADDLSAEGPDGAQTVRVGVTDAWNSQWLPLAGRLTSYDVSFPGGIPIEDLRYNPVTAAAVAVRTLGGADEYRFFSDPVATDLPVDATPSPLLDDPTYRAAEFLDNWAQAARRPSRSRLDAVRRAAALMRARGRYSDGAFGWEARFAQGQDQSRLDDFMNGPHMVGDDEQYAAAMALVATRLRVPARVVVGARVPAGGVVKGHDVMAWVEVRIKDGSWRELPRASYMSLRAPRRADPPNQPVVAPPPPAQPDPEPTPEASPSPQPRPDPEVERPEPAAATSHTWWPWLLLLVPAAVGAPPGFKLVRRGRRRRAARVSLRYAGAWQELVDGARDLGVAVPARRTRPDQAAALGSGAVDLARTADTAIFAAGEPPDDAAECYWRDVLEVRSLLAARASRRRRLLAPFNLASLRSG